ncbi:hypothetical protein [Pseudomonas putida]|jgi:hypothetical protein|uniref:hypothetical protein n=1 Tax=Pseudomonas putida TaxID=303 RepID=UPI002DBC6FE7|nr:hypothetical protein [Pseudomonas putida]WRW04709.1 hypothetical protein VPZ82_04620 [Pseudomonas putida]
MWEALRMLAKKDGTAITSTIAWHCKLEDSAVHDYLRGLEKAGIIRKVKALGKDAEWSLEKDEGVEAPRVNRQGKRQPPEAIEFVWRALRIMGELSAAEAAQQAHAGGAPITEQGARVYLQRLANAGYLVRTGGTPGNPAQYRLIPSRNSGPLYPVYQTLDQVFDPNIGKVIWSKGEQPDVAALNGYRIEAERLRALLREWAELDGETAAASPSLVARTREQLEHSA